MKSTTAIRNGLRMVLAVLVIAVTVLGSPAPGKAIINGTPDGIGHRAVGAIDVRPTGRRIPASGVLISPTVFLFAGHVGRFFTDAGLTEASVTFDPVFDGDNGTFQTGTIHINPLYTGRINDQNDLAVIVFPQPIDGIVPAQLPPANYLDTLSPQQLRSQSFPAVGYGISLVSGANSGGGQPGIDRTSAGTRRVGAWSFMSLSRDWVRFDMGAQQGCVGDSGAPNFLGTSNLIVGIGISGDFACEHMGSDIRLDSPASRAFIDRFALS